MCAKFKFNLEKMETFFGNPEKSQKGITIIVNIRKFLNFLDE